MIIKMSHLKGIKYCNRGSRQWFEQHDLDWNEFIKNGLDHQLFLKTGDAMAVALVEYAMKDGDK